MNKLFNSAFPVFFAEPGTPADLKGLYYISITYASIYENLLEWTIVTSSTKVNDECINLRDKLAILSKKALDKIWQFPFTQKDSLNKIKEKLSQGEKSLELNSVLTIEIDEQALEEYNIEFEHYKRLVLN